MDINSVILGFALGVFAYAYLSNKGFRAKVQKMINKNAKAPDTKPSSGAVKADVVKTETVKDESLEVVEKTRYETTILRPKTKD